MGLGRYRRLGNTLDRISRPIFCASRNSRLSIHIED